MQSLSGLWHALLGDSHQSKHPKTWDNPRVRRVFPATPSHTCTTPTQGSFSPPKPLIFPISILYSNRDDSGSYSPPAPWVAGARGLPCLGEIGDRLARDLQVGDSEAMASEGIKVAALTRPQSSLTSLAYRLIPYESHCLTSPGLPLLFDTIISSTLGRKKTTNQQRDNKGVGPSCPALELPEARRGEILGGLDKFKW